MPELSPRLQALAFVAALSVTTRLIYGDTIAYPFVFDDQSAIIDNATLSEPSLWAAFSPPADTSVSGRPLVNLSFALNRHLFGVGAESFRAFNIALHVLNAWLIFVLLRAVLGATRLAPRADAYAALSALLWACHPLQTEAVVYVTQRTELMASLFVLLTLCCSWRALQHDDQAHAPRLWSLLALLSCALGTGCKEILVAAPCIVLALDRGFIADSWRACMRRHGRLHLGLLLALTPLCVQLLTQPRDRSAGFGLGVSAWQSLANGGHACAWYLRLSVWPTPLSVTYNASLSDAPQRYLLADGAMAALFIGSCVLLARRVGIAVALVGFFAILAPSSSIIPILSEVAAERRMYLPLLAPVLSLVLGLAMLCQALLRPGARPMPWIACVCLLLTAACVHAARLRTRDYRSAEALFASALRADPDNPQAMWGLAAALDDGGQSEPAIALYERMAARPYAYAGPASWGTRGLLGAAKILARQGRMQDARRVHERALAHDPDSAIGQLHRASVYASSGEDQRAIAALEHMLTQPFLLERVHRELAALYARRGELQRAQLQLQAAQQERR